MPKTERAATALTEAELERLRIAARIEGATVSHLLRRAGLREAEQVLDARGRGGAYKDDETPEGEGISS